MTKDNLSQRVAKLEKAVAEIYDKCAIEAFATRLCVFPNAIEADEWRQKLHEIRARLPAKSRQRLK